MIGLLLITINIYAVTHMVVKETVPCSSTDAIENPCSDQDCAEDMGMLTWKNFARVDAQGRVTLRNAGELDWFVGADRVTDQLKSIRERTEEMDEIRLQLDENLENFAKDMINRRAADALSEDIIAGKYQSALAKLNVLSRELYTSDVSPMKVNLRLLDTKMKEQCQDLTTLTPPLNKMFFWTTPTLSLFEVLFWALFGVLTNLLVSSAEYLRKGTFQPVETWVAYTKLIYGPILAAVLVLSIIFGFFEVQSYQIRVWTLPLVGFLFGYSSRRTARLVDKLTEKFLGKASQGIEAGPETVAARRKAVAQELKDALRPQDMEELKDQAKKLAGALTAAAMERK